MPAAESSGLIHASAVAVGTAGVLITGKSGAGKSSLALALIALGAELVSDDQVLLTRKDSGLLMSAPSTLKNRIEARGIGVLSQPARPAWAQLVVDLDDVEKDRLPDRQEIVIAGSRIRVLRRVESDAFPSMLYVLLQGGLS
ncbi:serine kinase [Rhodobacteraceae bacterium]|nr:serine kinase [Paracoccaceae bacterium]